jgi:hypothetical protein
MEKHSNLFARASVMEKKSFTATTSEEEKNILINFSFILTNGHLKGGQHCKLFTAVIYDLSKQSRYC